MSKYKVIRGIRIVHQLEEALSYTDLEQKTRQFIPQSKKRQHAVQPVQIQRIEFVAAPKSNTLEVRGAILSNGNKYQSIILFNDVEFQTDDSSENVTFVGADNQTYHMIPIRLTNSNVKVRCTCLDFRWRFAMQNQQNDVLYGPGPDLYQRAPGSTRPPNNIKNTPGVCKHLLKLVSELKKTGMVQR